MKAQLVINALALGCLLATLVGTLVYRRRYIELAIGLAVLGNLAAVVVAAVNVATLIP